MTDQQNGGGTVNSDRTLIAILDGLAELNGAGVTELADSLNSPKSSVHKHLKTLEEEGLIINKGGHYRLGFRFLEYGGAVRDNMRLCRLAKGKALELNRETGELISFAIEENDYGVFALARGYDYNRDPLGRHFHLHQNSVGKSMLAEMSDERIDAIIDRRELPASTDETITSREALFEEIEKTRERGYALNMEERTESICAVGAAVYDEANDQLGALSLALARNRVIQEELEDTYATKILAATDELSLRLRYE